MKVSTRSSTTSDRNDKASDVKVPPASQKSASNSNEPVASSSGSFFQFEMLPEHIDKSRKKCYKVTVYIFFAILPSRNSLHPLFLSSVTSAVPCTSINLGECQIAPEWP